MWFPGEGYCFTGELKGEFLDPLVRMQCTWGEWKALHPDTKVMAPQDDPMQRDPRFGHGAEEYWGRPGIDQLFLGTFPGELDERLPEHEMMLGVNVAEGLRAYPYHDIKVEGGVVNDDLVGYPLVILSGPEQESVKATVWDRRVEGQLLEFELRGRHFVDRQTGSTWTIEGRAEAGPLAGKQLSPTYFHITRWHSWCYIHPDTEIWQTERQESPTIEGGAFAGVFDAWRGAGYDVKVERAIYNLELPLEADSGLRVRIDGDPFKLLLFQTPLAADDYTLFFPHSVRRGRDVLESFPDEQYTDRATQRVRLPEDEIEWSELLGHEGIVSPLSDVAPGEPEEPGFRAVLAKLKAEWDAIPKYKTSMDIPFHIPLLSNTARFPGVLNGFYATIGEEDPFLIYRMESEERARRYVDDEEEHAIAVGRYVFRSIPLNMYKYPRYALVDRPEEKVNWSDLLQDEAFRASMEETIVGRMAVAG